MPPSAALVGLVEWEGDREVLKVAVPGFSAPGGSVSRGCCEIKSKKTCPGTSALNQRRLLSSKAKGSARKALSAELKHGLFLRDQGQCQFRTKSGRICGEKKFVQIHHLEALWQGGHDEVENLITLCHRHHDFFHRIDQKVLSYKRK